MQIANGHPFTKGRTIWYGGMEVFEKKKKKKKPSLPSAAKIQNSTGPEIR